MLRVVVGNNTNREQVLVDENSTLREVLEDNEVDFSTGVMHLDGAPIQPGDLNKTFVDLGYAGTEGRVYLINVVKTNNA